VAAKLAAMLRIFGLLLLVTSLLWQSAAMAGGQLLPELAEDAEHAALHWQERAHHHHDDGSYDAHDGDAGAFVHVHFDGASGGAALPARTPGVMAGPEAAAPSFHYFVALPWPPLPGLRRPPRTSA
jgi:hypothetical protein